MNDSKIRVSNSNQNPSPVPCVHVLARCNPIRLAAAALAAMHGIPAGGRRCELRARGTRIAARASMARNLAARWNRSSEASVWQWQGRSESESRNLALDMSADYGSSSLEAALPIFFSSSTTDCINGLHLLCQTTECLTDRKRCIKNQIKLYFLSFSKQKAKM